MAPGQAPLRSDAILFDDSDLKRCFDCLVEENRNIAVRCAEGSARRLWRYLMQQYKYVKAAGGVVTAGMSIYDTMQFIRPDVVTVCMGQACSMGSFLLTAGAKGKRYSLPNSRIMIHQPLGGFKGQASDIEIHARETLRIKEELNRKLALHSGRSYEEIVAATDRDNFMSADEACKYGLVDKVYIERE